MTSATRGGGGDRAICDGIELRILFNSVIFKTKILDIKRLDTEDFEAKNYRMTILLDILKNLDILKKCWTLFMNSP
jgi:hypothetical protein